MLCCQNFSAADCMVLIAGEGNDGQDTQVLLLTPEVTVSSPTVVNSNNY